MNAFDWFIKVENEKLRQKLISNYDPLYNHISYDVKTEHEAILSGFDWQKSIEKEKYWNEKYMESLNKYMDAKNIRTVV